MPIILAIVLIVAFLFFNPFNHSDKPSNAAATPTPTVSKQINRQVITWYNANGYIFDLLGKDSLKIGQNLKSGNLPQAQLDCQSLKKNADYAQTLPTVPDAELDRSLKQMASDTSQAASECIKAIQTGDSALISKTTTEFKEADADAQATRSAFKYSMLGHF